MPTTKDIGALIVRDPDLREGRPRIADTGVTVRRMAQWYKLGLSPEEISSRLGHLSFAQVHAALAYYHANKETIEEDLSQERATAEKLKQQHTEAPSP